MTTFKEAAETLARVGSSTAALHRAIAAHRLTATQFERAVRSGGGGLEVDAVQADDRCLLGRWLHEDGRDGSLPATTAALLQDVHSELHKAAGAVLEMAVSGRAKSALRAVAPGSRYARWSDLLEAGLSRYSEAMPPSPERVSPPAGRRDEGAASSAPPGANR